MGRSLAFALLALCGPPLAFSQQHESTHQCEPQLAELRVCPILVARTRAIRTQLTSLVLALFPFTMQELLAKQHTDLVFKSQEIQRLEAALQVVMHERMGN